MRLWTILLGPMLTWTVQFFAGYIVSITIGGTATGRTLVLILSGLCLAANAWLLAKAFIALKDDDEFTRWIGGGAIALLILSTVGIFFQTAPALLT